MLVARNLEIHVTHACNLTCESCSHYSNQGHKGNLSLGEAAQWMGLWSHRIRPRSFSLVGGEPTIHPDLADFVRLSRRHWPHSEIRIVTNGFFLNRHPDLPAVMREAGNSRLCISIHHRARPYLEKLEPISELVRAWVRDFGIKVTIYPSSRQWTRRYRGFGAEMEPYDDRRPRESWEHCRAKYCRQLFEGKIWKCAPVAYLKLQQIKYGLSASWDPYLQYRPLSPECSDAELSEFYRREEEAACAMCPAKPEHFELPIPLRTYKQESST